MFKYIFPIIIVAGFVPFVSVEAKTQTFSTTISSDISIPWVYTRLSTSGGGGGSVNPIGIGNFNGGISFPSYYSDYIPFVSNPQISVTYGGDIINLSTGLPLTDGDQIPSAGTRLEFRPAPFLESDISWTPGTTLNKISGSHSKQFGSSFSALTAENPSNIQGYWTSDAGFPIVIQNTVPVNFTTTGILAIAKYVYDRATASWVDGSVPAVQEALLAPLLQTDSSMKPLVSGDVSIEYSVLAGNFTFTIDFIKKTFMFLSVVEPSVSISQSGTAQLSCESSTVCTVVQEGTLAVSFEYTSTDSKFWPLYESYSTSLLSNGYGYWYPEIPARQTSGTFSMQNPDSESSWVATSEFPINAPLTLSSESITIPAQTVTITLQGTPPTACADGIDNDGDGLIDYPADSGCVVGAGTSEVAECQDGIDNDGNGLIDLADSGCSSGNDDDEYTIPQCQDGIDNNGNGLIDYPADAACSGLGDYLEEVLPDADLTLGVSATRVRINETVILTWSATNTSNCTLSGTNGDFWNLSGTSGQNTSSELSTETAFTLSCIDLNEDVVTEIVNVKIVPSFQEVLKDSVRSIALVILSIF